MVAESKRWDLSKEGRSNSSLEFLFLEHEIGNIIRSEASAIVLGHCDSIGRTILARLTHQYGFTTKMDYKEMRKAKRDGF